MNKRHLRTTSILVALLLTGATTNYSIAQTQDKVLQVQFTKVSELAKVSSVVDKKVENEDSIWYVENISMDYEEQKFLYNLCENVNYPYELALAQIKYESNFKSDCIGSSGELGYMQILPSWDKYLEQELNKKINLKDSFDNIESGILLMRYNTLAQDKYEGREMYIRSLNVYNFGSSNYRQYCKSNAYDSWHYGKNIWKIYQEYLKGNYDYEVRK